ncbi:MAG: hypothetical protein DI586_03475 [Micavibrio aeruginosavorus]|uniref:Secreted protein n=1 Tax=Micavibrio aeruginosavorus TaxID=349221 RepID=A0A2W5FRR5_9BACT|nr:MAG: hypothetical protein DI586_03475 [Micavibrio aeruginosavorus]
MKLLHTLLVTTILTTGAAAYAAGDHAGDHGSNTPTAATSMSHDGMGHGGEKMEAVDARNTVKLALEPAAALEAGKTTQVTVKLNAATDGKPLTFDDLKEAHTKKLHLLVIDPSLSDYHHIHPVAGKNPGEYVFDFTPLKNDSYRVWADVIPVATDKQEYVQTDMGTPAKEKSGIDKSTNMTATVDGYTFTLALDGEPKAGAPVMGSVTVTKDGQPFTQLEPVMGAFAHVVGFTEDYNSVLHVHPMGQEPSSDTERGGPKLEFHIEPEKPGFVKLFAQVRIGGKDIFAPFGVTVK